jgi:hypothetical protein
MTTVCWSGAGAARARGVWGSVGGRVGWLAGQGSVGCCAADGGGGVLRAVFRG